LETERIKAVAELASGVAHNFNNLLQIVMGGAQMALSYLRQGNLAKIEKNMEQIVDSCRLGAETVKRLQDFSRLRGDRAIVKGRVFDLSQTVKHAIEMTEPWWKTKPQRDGIRLALNLKLDPDCLIKGKENEVFEVTVNLIKNAVEAMPDGGEIRIRSFEQDDKVILEVQDSGTGISSSDLRKVFDPFWTTKGFRGTGMGLSSSKGIIKDHAGQISVSSAVGEGSTFSVSFPPAKRETEESTDLINLPSNIKLSALIIDDVKPIALFLEQALSANFSMVWTATSGLEAIEMFKKNPIDFVICDLCMEGMNGLQVSAEIMSICLKKGIRKPYFFLLTGWSDYVVEKEKLSEMGVDKVLEKPLSIPELMKEVMDLHLHSGL